MRTRSRDGVFGVLRLVLVLIPIIESDPTRDLEYMGTTCPSEYHKYACGCELPYPLNHRCITHEHRVHGHTEHKYCEEKCKRDRGTRARQLETVSDRKLEIIRCPWLTILDSNQLWDCVFQLAA
jgi:hypothetical protein